MCLYRDFTPRASLVGLIAVSDFEFWVFEGFFNGKRIVLLSVAPSNLPRFIVRCYAAVAVHKAEAVDADAVSPGSQSEVNNIGAGFGNRHIVHEHGNRGRGYYLIAPTMAIPVLFYPIAHDNRGRKP